MDSRTPFGEWLRQRRHLLDLTQAELADQCHCSTVTIRKLEAGERKPSRELALTLAHVLRIPDREHAAFVQFARSDELEASFRLPAWESELTSWRSGQLPHSSPSPPTEPSGITLHYDLVSTSGPQYEKVKDGRILVEVQGQGTVTGDIEGEMDLRITQVINPKPAGHDYTQALPMQIGVFFTICSGEDVLEGIYTGILSPMTDAGGTGEARNQGTGQVISVTPGFIDLFLHYVFVDEVVKMVEGSGTGASGRMQLKPVS